MKKKLFLIICFFLILPNNILSQDNSQETNNILKIGIMAPFSGEYGEIGKAVLNASKIALKDLNKKNIKFYPKDNKASKSESYKIAKEFKNNNINLVIGPIFFENTEQLNEINNVTFLSLSNKLDKNHKNVITLGVNIKSQFNSIISYLKKNKLSKTLLLIPKTKYADNITKFYQNKNYDFYKILFYETDPKKITSQIEILTKYKDRKADLERRIKLLEKSELQKDKNELKELLLKDTLGNVDFDSVIIADFDERLKSVMASFEYVDVDKNKVKFFTLNQWFDESIFTEKSMEGLMFPSVDLIGYNKFRKKYFEIFEKVSSEISLTAYDSIGLANYIYLINESNFSPEKFNTKSGFKGFQGEFNIVNNRANHKLYMYEVYQNKFNKLD